MERGLPEGDVLAARPARSLQRPSPHPIDVREWYLAAVTSSIAGMLLGLVVGLRHAFEPDHLTAMATLVTETRDPRRGAALGALWGLGHTISLVVVGAILIALGSVLPLRLAAGFELAVSGVLVLLGIRAVVRAWRDGLIGPARPHAHGGRDHAHPGPDLHLHVGRWTLAWRPLAVGLVHGLAGSGALTALVFAQLPSTAERIAYISVFGVGSIVGMAVASAVVGASLGALHRGQRWLALGAGALSIGLGIAWSLPLFGQLV
jgi:high-affinity nickel-transport protein